VDKDGNLVGVGVTSTEDKLNEKEVISSADIRKELFEGANIRTRETDKAEAKKMEQDNETANVDMTISEKDGPDGNN
jgi:hypothetical protein